MRGGQRIKLRGSGDGKNGSEKDLRIGLVSVNWGGGKRW